MEFPKKVTHGHNSINAQFAHNSLRSAVQVELLFFVRYIAIIELFLSGVGFKQMTGNEVKTFISLVMVVVLLLIPKTSGNLDEFYRLRGRLIFQEEFNSLDKSRWQHVITAWRGGNNEFEYYTDRPENRYKCFTQLLL